MNGELTKDGFDRASAILPSRLARIPLRILSTHGCPFFSDRHATLSGVYALKKFGRQFSDMLEQGYWRRSDVIEKPACRNCNACKSIRVPVRRFSMSRSQRRVWKRNQDLTIELVDYAIDPEMLALLRHYLVGRHGWGKKAPDDRLDQMVELYAHRLGRSPVQCKVFKYRLPDGELVGLSIGDDCQGAFYSAFFAYHLEQQERGLGNFSILNEIDWCRRAGKDYYYLANLIEGFSPSDYKRRFKPYELRGDNGGWKTQF